MSWPVLTAVIAATTGVAVAFFTAWLARRLKISEFRQAWINDLRKDISDYLGASQRWFNAHLEAHTALVFSENPMAAVLRPETEAKLFMLGNEASVILYRIRMRFNPNDDNPSKAEDDEFLSILGKLRNPKSVGLSEIERYWYDNSENAVEMARRILKREWEVTKAFYRKRF